MMKFLVLALLSLNLFAQSSMQNREGKRFQLTGSPAGVNFSASGTGFQAAYFLSTNSQVGFGIYDIDGFDFRGTGAELFYKHFESNTFYYKPSIGYRNVTNDEDFFDFFGSTETADTRLRDLAVGIKIGNQWQFDSFTLGCDWFGYSHVVANFGRDDEAETSRYGHITIASFYLGASF